MFSSSIREHHKYLRKGIYTRALTRARERRQIGFAYLFQPNGRTITFPGLCGRREAGEPVPCGRAYTQPASQQASYCSPTTPHSSPLHLLVQAPTILSHHKMVGTIILEEGKL